MSAGWVAPFTAPPEWTGQALCAQADPDEWFPSRGGPINRAKAICGRCPVTALCLDLALTNREEHGVWGGLGPRQRSAILLGRDRTAGIELHGTAGAWAEGCRCVPCSQERRRATQRSWRRRQLNRVPA